MPLATMTMTPAEIRALQQELELLSLISEDDKETLAQVRKIGDDGTPRGVTPGVFLSRHFHEEARALCDEGLVHLSEVAEIRPTGRFEMLHARLTDTGRIRLADLRKSAAVRQGVATRRARLAAASASEAEAHV